VFSFIRLTPVSVMVLSIRRFIDFLLTALTPFMLLVVLAMFVVGIKVFV